MLNSAEHEISMLDKSHLINPLGELLIYRKIYCFFQSNQNLSSHTLSGINETVKFEHKFI